MSSLLSSGKRLILWGLVSLGPCWISGRAALAPQGGEYAMIGSLAGDQVLSDLALNSTGGYVVWHDNATDGDGLGISARRLDSSLSGYLNVFRVNEKGTGDQQRPRVALLKDGGAVFVWQGGPRGACRIYARFLNPNGTFSTGDIQVNTFAQQQQIEPDVAVLADGSVIVVWGSFGQDDAANSRAAFRGLQGVYAQRLSSAGAKLGTEFRVNQTIVYNQRSPVVAALPAGGFVVGWISEKYHTTVHATDSSGQGTDAASGLMLFDVDAFGRLFDGSGTALGSEFRLNTSGVRCASLDLAVSPEDGFVAVWTGARTQPAVQKKRTESLDIYTRAFGADGIAIGSDSRLNQRLFGDQFLPRITFTGQSYLVVWDSLNQDGNGHGVMGRVLGQDGATLGGEFVVNTTTFGNQMMASVSGDGEGRFLVVWSGFVGGVASFDLAAQRFSTGMQLFAPSTPFVLPLSEYQLSVAWPEVVGLDVTRYELFLDGSDTPVLVDRNLWVSGDDFLPGSTHTFRLAYRIRDGRLSPLSAAVTGKTWGKDANRDGLPDDWQVRYWGINPALWPAAPADGDHDGASNLQEFLAGTDPSDAASVLRLDLKPADEGRTLTWNTQPGSVYQVQVRTESDQWTDMGGRRFAAGSSDAVPVQSSRALTLYRVIRIRE